MTSGRAQVSRKKAGSGDSTRIRLTSIIFLAVLVQGPIYWWPGVPVAVWGLLKDVSVAVFIVSVIFIAIYNNRNVFLYAISVPEGKWHYFLIIVSFVGVTTASDPIIALTVWARLIAGGLVAACIYALLQWRPRLQDSLPVALAIPIVISAVYILGGAIGVITPFEPPINAAFNLQGWYLDARSYVAGFSHRTNTMSWSIAFAWPVLFDRALYHWRRRGIGLHSLGWAATSAIAASAAVVSTGRGGVIAIALAAVTVLIAYGASIKLWVIFLLTTGVVVVIPLVVITDLSDWYRLILREPSRQMLESPVDRLTSGRMSIYRELLHIIIGNPVAGVGIGDISSVFDRVAGNVQHVSGPHSLYLGMGAQSGVLALCGALAWAARTAIDRLDALVEQQLLVNLQPGFTAVIIVGLLNTIVESGAMFFSMHSALAFWVAVAVTARSRRGNCR